MPYYNYFVIAGKGTAALFSLSVLSLRFYHMVLQLTDFICYYNYKQLGWFLDFHWISIIVQQNSWL